MVSAKRESTESPFEVSSLWIHEEEDDEEEAELLAMAIASLPLVHLCVPMVHAPLSLRDSNLAVVIVALIIIFDFFSHSCAAILHNFFVC